MGGWGRIEVTHFLLDPDAEMDNLIVPRDLPHTSLNEFGEVRAFGAPPTHRMGVSVGMVGGRRPRLLRSWYGAEVDG